MSEHYFSKNPKSESNPFQFQTTLKSHSLTFQTDDGVFSKKQIDYGTQVLLESFEEPKRDGELLDVGCGYGPIGITLAKECPNRTIHLVDVNERAILLAQKNINQNRVENASAYLSDGLAQVKSSELAAIITNPPFRAGKQVVHQIIDDSYRALGESGELWVVVQKKQGAPSLRTKMESLFNHVEVVKRDKGYFVLKSNKLTS
ncbi:class I SAM-dependent methyltransferase [Alkalibacillus aidingensis]|uniref:class I SAM-dependent methyltransferase n=1 Tax=Alkalibacillus aidingensis TaxID=2747607 RepID=UPI00166096C5|nr:class I SAM-dependent methyltransferase [Alkalibacillus aidingensis]